MEVPFEFHRAKTTWVAISKYFEIQFWFRDLKGTLKLLSRLLTLLHSNGVLD